MNKLTLSTGGIRVERADRHIHDFVNKSAQRPFIANIVSENSELLTTIPKCQIR